MRAALIAGFLAAWAGTGCMWGKGLVSGPETPPAPQQVDKKLESVWNSKPAQPPVTADQISEENARNVADALQKELDREALAPGNP
jgi:hypothetical protein